MLNSDSRLTVTIMKSAYDPLIALHYGRAGIAPLFCIAGAGAGVNSFLAFKTRLPEDLPLLGLQARGLDGVSHPFSSVEAAARAYRNAVCRVWPSGPYRIVGHSFGGWVAFELAGLLGAAGYEVEALFLVDSEVPHAPGTTAPRITRAGALQRMVLRYNQLLRSTMSLSSGDFARLDEDAQVMLLEAELVKAGVLPKSAPSGLLRGPVAVYERNVRTTYHPGKIFDGTLWLVNAAEADDDVETRVYGWRRHATVVRFTTIPGNHMTMLLGKKGAHLGEWIGRMLERRSADDELSSTASPP